MTPQRWKQLLSSTTEQITEAEAQRGWHFCHEWDGLIIGPSMGEWNACQCFTKETRALCEALYKADQDSEVEHDNNFSGGNPAYYGDS